MSGIMLGLLFICSFAVTRCTGKDFFAEADALLENFEAAFDRQDADGVAEFFTVNGCFMEPEEDISQGREEIAEEMKEYFQMGITNLEQTTVEAVALDSNEDNGYAQGNYAALDNQGRVVDHGKYLTVLIREDDKLKIHKAMYNTNEDDDDDSDGDSAGGHDEF